MTDQETDRGAGGESDGAARDDQPKLMLNPTRTFPAWLASTGASLAFSTYQAGKIFFVGTNPEGQLSVFERSFNRCMGLGVGDGRIWLSSLYQFWRFENFLDPGRTHDGYDAVFVPVSGHTTGDIDIHDVHGFRGPDRPIFVVTRFNCLATLDGLNSFAPLWHPPFIDRIAAEDRCHLNGLAMRDGNPAFVTCVATTNSAGAWRDHRRDGGVLLDVASGEVVGSGFSMPHSPRWHDGQLYLLQSGTGEFGRVDLDTGRFEPLCFLPGFARGVSFLGNHAIIGVSRPRRERTFEGLALDEALSERGLTARCMIAVVNLSTGDIEHSMEIEGVVQELYDVAVLRGIRRPMALGFMNDEIRFMIRPGAMPAVSAPEAG